MNETDDSNVPIDLKEQFEEHAPEILNRLFRVVYSWTLDADLANEIVQEALRRFLSRMNKRNWSEHIKSFDAYLTVIARNYLRDIRRKQRKLQFVFLDDDPDGKVSKEVHRALLFNEVFTGVDPEQLEEIREELPLQMILHGFSEDDLKLLKLHRIDDLSPKKIAERTGGNADSLRYQLIKIEAKLRYRTMQYLKATGKKSLF